MAGFQAEMDSALVSRLTEPDQKLMKSKEIEKEKRRRSAEWPWRLGLEWKKLKNQGSGPWRKRFYFSRLIMMAGGSKMFLSLEWMYWKLQHINIFPQDKIWWQKCHWNRHWECITYCTSNSTHNNDCSCSPLTKHPNRIISRMLPMNCQHKMVAVTYFMPCFKQTYLRLT